MAEHHPVAAWSTREIVPARQFSSWREAVSATHLAWDLPARRQSVYQAAISPRMLGAASVVECVCDPCSGRRGRTEIARSSEAYYGVLYLLRGREMVRQAGREIRLEPGELTLWDSTRPIDFAIAEPLHKITLLVPQALLDRTLPGAQDQVARVVSGRSGCGALFTSHLRALARERVPLPSASFPALLGVTLDLLGCAITPAASAAPPYQQALLARVRAFIVEHLPDPGLAPARIAAAHGISVRHLHRLFESTGSTVERWIWQERLLRCHQALLEPGRDSISTIAFQWGFNDAAHFSRAFKRRFGVSPRQLRRRRDELAG
jgi:AraC-like DNA-binding protein